MKIFCSDGPYFIRNHLSFLFLCSVLNFFTVKLNSRPTIGLTYAIATVKGFFLDFFVYENIFYFSLLNFNL